MRSGALTITGVGAVTPLGIGVDALARALATSAVVEATALDDGGDPLLAMIAPALRRVAATPVPSSPRTNGDLHRIPRVTSLALAASREALVEASLDDDGLRTGLVVATALGPIVDATAFVRGYLAEGCAAASPRLFAQAMPAAVAGQLSIEHALRGPTATVHHRDTSPLAALGVAARWLELGRADAVLIVAVDEASHVALHGHAVAGALTPTHTHPYDRARDGFVLADAAAAFVLERRADARARHARERATLLAVCESSDDGARLGWRRRSIDGAVRAVRDVSAVAERIDWVAGGGNGTTLDSLELDVLAAALGPTLPPLSSIVGQTGESPASAALRLVSAVIALETQRLPGTVGLTDPPPAHAPALVRAPRGANVERVLIPSLGQGGANVIVALGRA